MRMIMFKHDGMIALFAVTYYMSGDSSRPYIQILPLNFVKRPTRAFDCGTTSFG
jgi:hypothetical protein